MARHSNHIDTDDTSTPKVQPETRSVEDGTGEGRVMEEVGGGGAGGNGTTGPLGSCSSGRKASVAGETRSAHYDRRFSTNSIVSLEHSAQAPNAFGISFETRFPSSEYALPPRTIESAIQQQQFFPSPPLFYGPPPPHFFDYSPPSGVAFLPPTFGPPLFHAPPIQHLTFHPIEPIPPPPSPYTLSTPSSRPEELVGPKPCAVWNCFKPTFCQLAPCGCGLCRDHLGTVIRGAKVDEESGTEGEAKKKRFQCVACRAKSHTMGPARSEDAVSSEVEVDDGANDGFSKARSRASSDESLFSVYFTAPTGHSRSTSRDTFSPPPSVISSPHQFPTLLPVQRPFSTIQPIPPPPYEPRVAQRVRAFSSPPTSSINQRISFFEPPAPVALVPTMPAPKPTKQKSFNGTSTTPAPAGPLERLSQAELVQLRERGSPKWKDWRSPVQDPSEPYQLQEGDWPIVKVENIPFNVTVKDLEAWLPPRCLPSPENVVNSIHIILHRPTGRTLPHCYLEMASLAQAHRVIQQLDRSQLGDRTVRVKWERRGELMRDIFSQEQYFAIPAPSAAAAPLPPVPTNYKFPKEIINGADMSMLLTFCQSPPPWLYRPTERPFLNLISIVTKFPWAREQLWNAGQRDALFDTVFAAMGTAACNSEKEPLFSVLLRKMSIAVLACDGFTDQQKETVKTLKAEEYLAPAASPVDSSFSPLTPPASTTSETLRNVKTAVAQKPVPPPPPPRNRNSRHLGHPHVDVAISQRSPPPETPPPSPKVVNLPRPSVRDLTKQAGGSRGGWGAVAEREFKSGVPAK